jgi:hypothetical protein
VDWLPSTSGWQKNLLITATIAASILSLYNTHLFYFPEKHNTAMNLLRKI